MSLTQFLQILLARRWMIIAAVVASFLGAMVVVALVPPRYQASSRVMLDIIKPDPVTGSVIGTQFLRAYTKTQTELIRDYKVAGPVVDELGWTRDPVLMEQFGGSRDPEAARRQLAQGIIDRTEAKLIEGSNILEITYTAWSPDAAKTVADAIRKSYVNATLNFKRESANQTADWYQLQTENARRLLAIAEDEKAKFERTHGLILQPDKSDVDSARLAALSGQMAPVSSGGIPSGVQAPSPTSTQVAILDAQIEQYRRTLGPNHPAMRDAQQRRAALATQAEQERAASGAALAAARSSAGAASVSATANQKALDAQRAKVLANRDKLSRLRQLQDEVDLRRDQFVKAAQRSAELRLQGNVSEAGLTILGNAVAPEKPSFPNIPLILFGSIGFGFALGLLAALLTELLNRRVRSGRDMENAAGDVPMLGIVTSLRPERKSDWFKLIKRRTTVRNTEEALAA